MDRFGREQLRELLERASRPAVSIYMPTHRPNDEADADRLRFRAALETARNLPTGEGERGEVATLLADLEPLVRDEEFWRHQADGLAVFRARGVRHMYRLPTELPELVTVGSTFHTRPLVHFLQGARAYWLLFLSQKEVRVYRGSPAGLRRVEAPAVPRSMEEALGHGFERDPAVVVTRKETRGRHGEHGRGGITPVFHGHGVGANDSEPELRRFFREVGQGLRPLLGERPAPVVLAAVAEHHTLFRAASGLDSLAERGIEASVRDWSLEALHAEAWAIAREEMARALERGLQLWERAVHVGKAESDLAALGRLAVAGRVRLLMLEEERRIWGRLDRHTGEVERLAEGGSDPGPEAEELLDELSEAVLLRGGDVLAAPPERMPVRTGAAAVLR